ncbi:MAG: V-type ATP synthase subunit F [Synergistaceae bacterium]|nr:V-type ATP synthase subunit F [Synergistaceae bacterium]
MADSKPMAAIGSYEMALPFQAVGVKSVILTAENRNSFEAELEKLAREDYAVVFIQEDLFVDFAAKVEEINDKYQTSVLPVPSPSGATGAGLASIRGSVEKAVGMDIFAER